MIHLLTYDWVINSIMVVTAILIIFLKIDIYKVIGYDIFIDLFFTIALLMYFAGSYNGMLVASSAGLILSIVLRATRWTCGYKLLKWRNGRLQWIYYPR